MISRPHLSLNLTGTDIDTIQNEYTSPRRVESGLPVFGEFTG